ncbi:DUF2798 domain-containing protein [Oribacterium sp. P6A1]|uniref:DUF2798 domain-containing protein n=1 Tax=Oribacterium sp. P6A1 TaxID=1410612 RepID=UPI00068FD9A4|nr:DUF2798 domain-containing protein [Oribacterium sp. P6A1]
MREKTRFFRWNVITNICMALSINTTATLLAGGDILSGWVKGCCCAFTINTVAAVIIPVGAIGKWFAEDLLKTKPGRFSEMLARNFIINAIYVTIVSLSMALINVGAGDEFLGAWWSTYPILHVVGLITSLIIEKPLKALV